MELDKEAVRNWWAQTTGEEHYTKALFGKYEKTQKTFNRLRKATHDLVSDGFLVRSHNKKDGYYRLVEVADSEIMWWEGEPLDDSKVNLILPFGLHKAVWVPKPALITVAGDWNAGKTAIVDYILNVNLEKFDEKKLLMTEGIELLQDRMLHALPKCPIPPPFQTFKKTEHFEDDVLPDGLTIIDYLRPPNSESLMSIGEPLKAIASKLKTGIAVVALQKPPGDRGDAYGGAVTQWDTVLSMSLHKTGVRFESYLKLQKIKKFLMPDKDLYSMKIRFKIAHGFS